MARQQRIPETRVQSNGNGYTALTDEMKRQVLTQRLSELEANHYNTTVSIKIVEQEQSTDADPSMLQANLRILEAGIRVVKDELAQLG